MKIQVYNDQVYGSWEEAAGAGAIYEQEIPSVMVSGMTEGDVLALCQQVASLVGDCLDGRDMVKVRMVLP